MINRQKLKTYLRNKGLEEDEVENAEQVVSDGEILDSFWNQYFPGVPKPIKSELDVIPEKEIVLDLFNTKVRILQELPPTKVFQGSLCYIKNRIPTEANPIVSEGNEDNEGLYIYIGSEWKKISN
jgi:hypothetical protein